MNITTGFKIGIFTLTAVVSSLIVWFDWPAHMGTFAGMMVFLAGTLVLFCYELYTRMYTDIYRKHVVLKDKITSVFKMTDLLQQQQSEVRRETTSISDSLISSVDLLTRLVEHMEQSSRQALEDKASLVALIGRSSEEALAANGQLEERIDRSSEEALEANGQLEERIDRSSEKVHEAVVQLQKIYEIAAKRDLEAKEKLVEIAGQVD